MPLSRSIQKSWRALALATAALAGLAAVTLGLTAGSGTVPRPDSAKRASAALPASTPLAAPKGEVLLTIDGAISNGNDGPVARLDRTQLKAIGWRELKTGNPFIRGAQWFEGVPFSDLLDRVGAHGETLTATAIDGYSVDIPMEDLRKYPVLLAMKRNGVAMDIRDKGPIWVIYPIAQHPELQTETYSVRSVWQLAHLTVK